MMAFAPRSRAPGPSPVVPLFTYPFFRGDRDPIAAMVQDAERFGDVVRYRAGLLTIHSLRDPDDIKHVLQENHGNYTKGRGIQKMRTFLGEGLLTSEGDFWKRQRRLAQPAFHRQRLEKLTGTMATSTAAMLDGWEGAAGREDVLDVSVEMARVTLRIAGLCLFGVDTAQDAERVGRALTTALAHAQNRVHSFIDIPEEVPTRQNRAFREARAVLDGIVYGIIERRRKSGEDTGDLLSMLMGAKDEETGETMSDQHLRDEIMTLILAGHETTANALAWTLYLLSTHPEAARRLRSEAESVLGGRAPAFTDLPNLRYTRMVLEEAMRLYPPAWIFGRRAKKDDVVSGYRIPAGTTVVVCTYSLHRHRGLWPNPEGFEPERFYPEVAAKRHKFAYLPFGGGPRICIGNQFALMEAQIILAMMAQRYRLDLEPGHPVEMQPMITLRPRYGMRMAVRPA